MKAFVFWRVRVLESSRSGESEFSPGRLDQADMLAPQAEVFTLARVRIGKLLGDRVCGRW
ncbi:hypothetical protein SCP_0508790 [Sparassis crispa]|uniref:Uncharacterized protein n=1 Tax=Sparassis crispa TaxID=139825 RepID=A0A401GNP4_9APHY|nr:hypothetical protein SCP_0508790 [Sparassis crispa]GBE83822.1 hypothetical protein SCP_0508790 [Sparassis crispa]